MVQQKAQELTAMRPWLPFRNFLAILEAWIENINWTAKDFCTLEILTACLDTAEDLYWHHTIGLFCMIVEPDCIR
jgi:hypothetical protein